MDHFSAGDYNWPWGPPAGAGPAARLDADRRPRRRASCGSIVACEDQTLRERLPVNGTPFSLYYASDRVPGRDAERRARRAGHRRRRVPPQLKGIVVQASVAGRLFEQLLLRRPATATDSGIPIAPNLHWQIPWDGTDATAARCRGGSRSSSGPRSSIPAQRYETDRGARRTASAPTGTPASPGSRALRALRGASSSASTAAISIGSSETCSPRRGAAPRSSEDDDRAVGRHGRAGDRRARRLVARRPPHLRPERANRPPRRRPHRAQRPAAIGDHPRGRQGRRHRLPRRQRRLGEAGEARHHRRPAGRPRRHDLRAQQPRRHRRPAAHRARRHDLRGLRPPEPSRTACARSRSTRTSASTSAAASRPRPTATWSGSTRTGAFIPIAGVDWSGTPAPNDLGDGGPATAAKLMDVTRPGDGPGRRALHRRRGSGGRAATRRACAGWTRRPG